MTCDIEHSRLIRYSAKMLHEEPRPYKHETTGPGTHDRIRLPTAERRWNVALIVFSLGALFGAWGWIELAGQVPLNLSACFSVRFLGKPCPLCGLTRGLHAVWQGDLAAARLLHPLSLAAFILLIAETLGRLILLLARCTPDRWKSIARGDIQIHTALAAVYCGYAMAWFLHRCWP